MVAVADLVVTLLIPLMVVMVVMVAVALVPEQVMVGEVKQELTLLAAVVVEIVEVVVNHIQMH